MVLGQNSRIIGNNLFSPQDTALPKGKVKKEAAKIKG